MYLVWLQKCAYSQYEQERWPISDIDRIWGYRFLTVEKGSAVNGTVRDSTLAIR
jgi:hypothetical protein